MCIPNWDELRFKQCEDEREREQLVIDSVIPFLRQIQKTWGENAYSEEERHVDILRSACEKIGEATEKYWTLYSRDSEKPYVEAWLAALQHLLELEVRVKTGLIRKANADIAELKNALETLRDYC
jgi:uncharacterized protein YcaQ